MTKLTKVVSMVLTTTTLMWLCPNHIAAQEMKPLVVVAQDADDDVVSAYVMRRCAALLTLHSIMWREQEPDLAATFAARAAVFIQLAKEGARSATGSVDVDEVTRNEITDIVGVYAERVKRNRALTGNFFADDPLMTSDGDFCKGVYEGGAQD